MDGSYKLRTYRATATYQHVKGTLVERYDATLDLI